MAKIIWKPGTMTYPVPAVMVTCGDSVKTTNIITIAWTGTVCSEPAITYVSIRPSRYSHGIITRTGEFVINLTTKKLAYATDYCGVKSGRDEDKFKAMKLTPIPAKEVSCAMIKESPLSIECKVTEVKELGTHDMFMAKVLCINADDKYLDKKGVFRLDKAELIAYSHGKYYTLGKYLGHFGYSVKKKRRVSTSR